MLVHLQLVSGNRKTGPIPVSTSSDITCPDSCPLKSGGCYAASGSVNIWWMKVSNGLKGMKWNDFCAAIARLPRNTLWRHNQAGDLPGINEEINGKQLRELVKSNTNKKGFAYTHKYKGKKNLRLIKEANDNGFTINLSANSPSHADYLKSLNAGPVVTILDSKIDGSKTPSLTTPKGNKIVVCPAVYRDYTTCQTCQLCQKVNRTCIVGFPAHGNAKAIVDRKTEAIEKELVNA